MGAAHRRDGNVEGHNTSLATVRIAIDEAKTKVPVYISDVDKAYSAMQEDRIAKVRMDQSSVQDDFSGYKSIPTVWRFPAGTSKAEANKMLDEGSQAVLGTYCNQILEHLRNFPAQIRPFLCDKGNELNILLQKQKGPVDSVAGSALLKDSIAVEKDNGIPPEAGVSYCYKLAEDDGKELVKPSPWSVWVKQGAPGTSAQFLVGDGWALTDIKRQIWRKLRGDGMEVLEEFVDNVSIMCRDTGYSSDPRPSK